MRLSQISIFQKNLFLLVHLKGLFTNGFAKRYYSQWGEDIVIQRLFANKKNGFYVDVGAYHPLHYSNTNLLYKKGWTGINIDPNPFSIALFNLHRPRDININYGIASEVTSKPYYIFNHQSCNTFSETQKNLALKKSFVKFLGVRTVECVPLRNILDQYAKETIDFLNVDVEGLTLSVLQSLDWERQRPNSLCVEDDDFDFSQPLPFGSQIFAFLTKKSYVLYAKVGLSCVYVSK